MSPLEQDRGRAETMEGEENQAEGICRLPAFPVRGSLMMPPVLREGA